MPSSLGPREIAALAETVEVLVSPLVYPSVDEWRRAVHLAAKRLFAADHAMTILPRMGEQVVSQDLDDVALASIRTWFRGFMPNGRLNMQDPVVNEWNDERRRAKLRIYTRDIIDRIIGGRVERSPFVVEALWPNRMRYWQGVYAEGPEREDAILWVSHDTMTAPGAADRGEALLAVLAPAFQAGLSIAYRVDVTREIADQLDAQLLVVAPNGRELHRTERLNGFLRGHPDRHELLRSAAGLASRFGEEIGRRRLTGSPVLPLETVVNATVGRCVLRATLLPDGAFGSGRNVAVLFVTEEGPRMPEPDELVTRFGLTPREAEVALRLAAGDTRDQIAAVLCISPHTVRAHTERIFGKLGVSNRASVAPRILSPRRT